MDLRTKVNIEFDGKRIDYSSHILSLGSCFSVHIGTILKNLKYNILQNPLGITFNPISINTGIKRCISSISLPETELLKVNDLWVNHDFHGSFNHPDQGVAYESMSNSLSLAHSYIEEVDTVFITLGTSFVFELDGEIVNNCHKRPTNLFNNRLLSIEEISDSLQSTINLLTEASNKSIQFFFSLSPVRHIKNGLSNNHLSKARLKEAIYQVCLTNQKCHYFPAYEIVMDELRDYRFFADDMVHPSSLTVQYIYDLFEENYLKHEELPLRKKINKIKTQLAHKPLHPLSKEHALFKKNLISEIETLEQEEKFDFSEEKNDLLKLSD